MDENEIVKTYSLIMNNNILTSPDLDYLRSEIDDNYGGNTDEVTFTLSQEFTYSYKELNNLPPFEGF